MKRAMRVLIPAIIVIAAAYFGWRYFAGRDAEADGAITVSGNIEVEERDLSFKIAGRVEERLVSEGDIVEAGRVVARLGDAELAADVALKTADVAVASAVLAELVAGSRPEEIGQAGAVVKQAEARVAEMTAGARPEERESAEAAVRSAQAELDRLKSDYERAKNLFDAGVVSGQAYDAAKTAYDVAGERLKTAKEQRDMVLLGPRVEQIAQAKAGLLQARETFALVKKGPRAEKIDQARARLTQAEEALALARTRLGYAVLTAPAAGMVTSENIESGEYVMPGTPVVTVATEDPVYLRTYIGETDIGRVKLGQSVRISVDSFKDKVFLGKITFISPVAEFTPKNVETREMRVKLVYRMKVEVPNASGELKPGMPADVEIVPDGRQ